ncbi:MAG TPA: hypothetical protein LFV92_01810 [Rickettsia endosymbiont of Ceroptres masudai]|nr:hypothetical protein [Rickettsia endosymbiont of Ceroptres masudai]
MLFLCGSVKSTVSPSSLDHGVHKNINIIMYFLSWIPLQARGMTTENQSTQPTAARNDGSSIHAEMTSSIVKYTEL